MDWNVGVEQEENGHKYEFLSMAGNFGTYDLVAAHMTECWAHDLGQHTLDNCSPLC